MPLRTVYEMENAMRILFYFRSNSGLEAAYDNYDDFQYFEWEEYEMCSVRTQ